MRKLRRYDFVCYCGGNFNLCLRSATFTTTQMLYKLAKDGNIPLGK